jgi:hypothetical protein
MIGFLESLLMIGIRRTAWICWLSLLALDVRTAAAQVNQEYDLKAAYLYRFTQYVEWPKDAAGADNTFVIGVVGQDPFPSQLDRIAKAKKVQNKQIIIRRFASAKDYQPCHILFVSAFAAKDSDEKSAEQRLSTLLPKTKGTPVLLVSDAPGLASKGAVINFFVDQQENRIKLEVNREAEKQAGLRISSELLELGVVKIVGTTR